MWSSYGAKKVVRGLYVGNPVSQRFIYSVLQGFTSSGDWNNLGTQKSHSSHVEGLSFGINFAHVDNALKAE